MSPGSHYVNRLIRIGEREKGERNEVKCRRWEYGDYLKSHYYCAVHSAGNERKSMSFAIRSNIFIYRKYWIWCFNTFFFFSILSCYSNEM